MRAAALYDAAPKPDSPGLKALVAAALDAACSAGATYAEVHVRVSQRELLHPPSTRFARGDQLLFDATPWQTHFNGLYYPPERSTTLGFGIRALVQGAWGFAGSTELPTIDRVAACGRTAAVQAKRAAQHQSGVVELAPAPAVTGTWVMPGIDPIAVPLAEKLDVLGACADAVPDLALNALGGASAQLLTEERTFASSEGAFTTQVTYTTGAQWNIGALVDPMEGSGAWFSNFLTPVGAGWEYIATQPFAERARELIDYAGRLQRKTEAVQVGRYDVVFDAYATAALLDDTLGTATELDRAMGALANSVGTSYLNDPVAMLGTDQVAAPVVTVTTNRSMPGGAATVKWDDEGVVPRDTALITNGQLTDFQTTRESATWLRPAYQRLGRQVVSNGCAHALGATTPMSQRHPNMVLHPGAQALTFDELVKGTKRGYAVLGHRPGNTNVYDIFGRVPQIMEDGTNDSQVMTGTFRGQYVVEIQNGQLGRWLGNAELTYRTSELWRNVTALGGPSSVGIFGLERWREMAVDRTTHTVSAIPMLVANVAITDARNRV